MTRYVAYDADTFKFKGFYSPEVHKVIPQPSTQIEDTGYVERKGQHSHYNPDTDTFYTPQSYIDTELKIDNIAWRNNALLETDKYMLVDYPISPVDKETVLQYRQALRDYPETWIRPELGAFVG